MVNVSGGGVVYEFAQPSKVIERSFAEKKVPWGKLLVCSPISMRKMSFVAVFLLEAEDPFARDSRSAVDLALPSFLTPRGGTGLLLFT